MSSPRSGRVETRPCDASVSTLAGLFGIRADFGTLEDVEGSTESPYGTLHGVRAIGFDLVSVPVWREPLEA